MPTLADLFGGMQPSAARATAETNPASAVPAGSPAYGEPKAQKTDINDQLAGDTLTTALKKLKVNVDPVQFVKTLQHDPQSGIYTGTVSGQQLYLRNVGRPPQGDQGLPSPDSLMVIPRAEVERIKTGQQVPSLLGQAAATAAPRV